MDKFIPRSAVIEMTLRYPFKINQYHLTFSMFGINQMLFLFFSLYCYFYPINDRNYHVFFKNEIHTVVQIHLLCFEGRLKLSIMGNILL